MVGIVILSLYTKTLRVREVKSCAPELPEDFVCRLESQNLAFC